MAERRGAGTPETHPSRDRWAGAELEEQALGESAFFVSVATGLLLSAGRSCLPTVALPPLFGCRRPFSFAGSTSAPRLIDTGALAVAALTLVALAVAGLEGEALVLGALAGAERSGSRTFRP